MTSAKAVACAKSPEKFQVEVTSARLTRRTARHGKVLCIAASAAALMLGATAVTSPVRAETVAGVTDGTLSVDAAGAANYVIPIAVPPGVAGMQPDLSLIYNSRGDNGILGVGWSVGGLSIIQRCPRTIAQDGVAGGVKFDADDRFCLDGQRLIAVSGTYGANGTEYRTEIDTFSRIVSHGTAGTGPESFTVETKSGQLLEYGGTLDSRILLTGRPEVRFWALNRVEDTADNYMTLHYLEDAANETCRIDRIEYAGNTTVGTLPQSEVRFAYELRPDQRSHFQGGTRINMTHRLTGIETYTDTSLVRDYRFAYDESPASGRSRLLSVTECAGNGDCLAPTSFGWAGGAPGWELEDLNTTGPTSYANPIGMFAADLYSQAADINGDGLQDILVNYNGGILVNAYINNGTGWEDIPAFHPPYLTSGNLSTGIFGDLSEFVDVNGDGLLDQIYHRKLQSGTIESGAHIATGSGWQLSPQFTPPVVFKVDSETGSRIRIVELNGDGLLDLVYHNVLSGGGVEKGAYLNSGTGWLSAPQFTPPHRITVHDKEDRGVRFLDVNGDGLADQIFHLESVDQGAYLNTGNGWESAPEFTPAHPIALDTRSEIGVRFIDVNGDGLTDQIFSRAGIDEGAYLNTGQGWVSAPEFTPLYPISDDSANASPMINSSDVGTRFIDVNGDGLVDQIYNRRRSSGDVKGAYINTGNGWRQALEYTPSRNTSIDIGTGLIGNRFIDFTGDGLDDFIDYYTNISTTFVRAADRNRTPLDLVVATTDSLGQSTTIAYVPLTDASAYTKGSGATFPEQDFIGALHVVKETLAADGVGGQARTTYRYEGARIHVQGRGFLGFARMTAVEETTGIETVTDYRQDFPFIGQVAATETRLPDGTLLRRVTDTWAELSLNVGKTSFPYVSQSQAQAFEINDGPGNAAVTTVTTNTVYDDYGNPTSIVATTSGGGETFTKTTTNTYTNDTVKWFLGRLTRAEVVSTLPDLSSDTRVSAFAYDALTGLLTREEVEPDLPAFRLTTDYGHDSFGNVISTTVSGTDITTRSSGSGFSADGRFATSATNALNHAETRAYDARYGLATSLTGPNGITTTWSYDGFGRKTREVRADGSETTWSYDLCVVQCPAGAVYAVVRQDLNTASQTPIGPRAVEYFDALNRAFRTETEGFDGTLVYANTEFNARGEVVSVTKPYFAGTAAQDIQKVTTTYDDIGRPLTVTQPDGGLTTTSYAGLTTSSTNALNQTETRKNDALGRLVEATDNLGTKVTYIRDPFDNLVETDAGGVVTTMTYDIRGRKTSMSDPDMGIWLYNHNVLGELTSQTDAKGQTATLTYDVLGRMTQRVENEGTTDWTYDTATKGIGKLQSVTAPGGYLRAHSYDSLGRPSGSTITIDAVNYTTGVTYDTSGRVETQSYPSGFTTRNAYNARGFLTSVSEDGGTTVYWQADSVNAEGQVTQETFGNGVVTTRAYDAATSLVDSISTLDGATTVQDLAFDFDKLGNLKKRSDLRQDREESSLYDGLNRLTTNTLTDTGAGGGQLAVTTYSYDTIGNITNKSDVGAYTYGGGGAGPHAVTSAGGNSYAYDANGNMTSGAGRTVAWSSFNKPTLVTETASGNQAGFTYGPDRARIKQHIVENSLARDVVYVGGLYEKRSRLGNPDELVHYIVAGTTVAIYTIHDDGLAASNKNRYLHRDHLGSVDSITGETGAVVERLSFDPHGKRRLADWQAGTPTDPDAETPRGFTGHEHLDSVGLIHMNGRVYDPTLGRFLSADPNIQAPDNTQNFNRYSYVNNNPLSYTDPTGFFFKKIKKFFKKVGNAFSKAFNFAWKLTREALQNQYFRMAAMVAASFVPGPWSILAVASVAGISTIANGGSLTQAFMSAAIAGATAYAFYGIGEAFSTEAAMALHPVKRILAKAVAHGWVGGISSQFQGGKFHEGFAAAGVAQLAAPAIGAIGIPGPQGILARTALAATAGGLGAKLGGGKFKNGAITAAFSYLFNDAKHKAQEFLSREDLTAEEKLNLGAAARIYKKRLNEMSDEEIMELFDIGGKFARAEVGMVRVGVNQTLNPLVIDAAHVAGSQAFHNIYVNAFLLAPLNVSLQLSVTLQVYRTAAYTKSVIIWNSVEPDYSIGCTRSANCVATTPRGAVKLP